MRPSLTDASFLSRDDARGASAVRSVRWGSAVVRSAKWAPDEAWVQVEAFNR